MWAWPHHLSTPNVNGASTTRDAIGGERRSFSQRYCGSPPLRLWPPVRQTGSCAAAACPASTLWSSGDHTTRTAAALSTKRRTAAAAGRAGPCRTRSGGRGAKGASLWWREPRRRRRHPRRWLRCRQRARWGGWAPLLLSVMISRRSDVQDAFACSEIWTGARDPDHGNFQLYWSFLSFLLSSP